MQQGSICHEIFTYEKLKYKWCTVRYIYRYIYQRQRRIINSLNSKTQDIVKCNAHCMLMQLIVILYLIYDFDINLVQRIIKYFKPKVTWLTAQCVYQVFLSAWNIWQNLYLYWTISP